VTAKLSLDPPSAQVPGVAEVTDGYAFHEWPSLAALTPYLGEGWRSLLLRPGDAAGAAEVKTQFLYRNPRGAKLAEAYSARGSESARLDREGKPVKAPAASDPDLVIEHLLERAGRAKVVLGYDEGMLAAGYANHYVAEALVAAANDWTVHEWLDRDPRLFAVIFIANAIPDRAVEEIKRHGSNPRFVGVAMGPNSLSRPFGHPIYHKIYQTCQELDLPLVIQTGSDNVADSVTPPVSGGLPATFGEYRALATQSHMTHLASMIIQGVFEHFPRLRVLLVGGGATWLPGWLWRLDYFYKTSQREAPWLTRLPSEYAHSNVWLSTDGLEDPPKPGQLRAALEIMPDVQNRLVYASCYPNEDYEEPGQVAARLPVEWAPAVFRSNALQVFR
jgi:predicted TIM-barrel fold metal-dependent hydrolase